jgi:hypothetical protein
MTVAILEIAPHGHYTYVESIAKIYTSIPENKVLIFTNENGKKALQHLVPQDSYGENQQISLKIAPNTEGGYSTFFSQIKNVDLLFVVTLEAYAKEPFRIMQTFEKTDFNCPIYYTIHNVDFWFQQSFSDKIRNVFYKLTSFKDFTYRLKIYFYYTFINARISKKVKNSGGKFVTLTSNVGRELAKHVGVENVAVVPFSFFDGVILEKYPKKPNTRFRICIPGYVSAFRRDYTSVLDLFTEDKDHFLRDHIELDFLGGIPKNEGGEDIKNEVSHWISKGYKITIYNKPAVGLEEFDENLAQADLILGNMHLQQGANSTYGKSKETGLIFTMIKAAKVGLLPADYPVEDALKTSTLTFRTYPEIASILKKLIENKTKWHELEALALKNSEKFRPLSIYHRLVKNRFA